MLSISALAVPVSTLAAMVMLLPLSVSIPLMAGAVVVLTVLVR